MPSRSLRELRAIASDLEIRKIDELGKSRLKNKINNMLTTKDGVESPYKTAKKECKDLKQVWDRDLFCRQDKRKRHHRNVTRLDDINEKLDKQISEIVYKRKGKRDRRERRKTMAEREKEEMEKILINKWAGKKEEQTITTMYETESVSGESEMAGTMEDESVGSESGMAGAIEDESVSGESEMGGPMEDEKVSNKVDVETNTGVFDEDENDKEWENQSVISENSRPPYFDVLDNKPLPTSSLGGGAASTKPPLSEPDEMMSKEDTIFKQFIQARQDRDVQRFIGMLVAADVLKSRRKRRRFGRTRQPEKPKREYRISGNGNVVQEINFFGSKVGAKLKQIKEGGQPIQIIGIQNNYYGSQGQQRDANQLKKTCEELYGAIRAFKFSSWRSYRDVFSGFIKLCFQVVLKIVQFVWDNKAVTIPAITILLVLYFGVGNILAAISGYIRDYLKNLIMSILRTLPGFALLEGGLGTLGSAFENVQKGTENLFDQGMDAAKDFTSQGMDAVKDFTSQGMDAANDLYGATKDFWGQGMNATGDLGNFDGTMGNTTTGFTFTPNDSSSGYTFVPGTVYEADLGSNYVDIGNATNISDPYGFGFGTFLLDPITGNFTYSNTTSVAAVNGTSVDIDANGDLQLIELPVDSPVFISRESYNEVVDDTIQNMTDALAQNISEKVVENVNATFTEAINANLNELVDTLSDLDVINEIDMLQRDISDDIEDLKKEVTFTLALEAVVPEQILKDKTEKINKKSFDFISAIRRKLKGVENGIVDKAIQGTFDKMKRNIGRYGTKMKSVYDKAPAFPKELVETIKTKAKNLVKIDLRDLKEFFGEGESDELDYSIISQAEDILEQSKQFRFKRMLERAASEDTTDLSQSLTRQVNDNTNSIDEAYKDIVDALSSPPPTEISEIEMDGLEEITKSYIENGGLTPMEPSLEARDVEGDKFEAEPSLSVEETKYYMKLYTKMRAFTKLSAAAGLIGVSLLQTAVVPYIVKPEVAAVITEGLRYYAGGQFVPGGGRAPAGGGWFSPQN